jgi:MerR family mercuric resistance operon transcriptional regulator
MSERLRSGELARRAGVNVETLRFYERRGLLPEPPRRPSGYREYPEDAVERILFIKRAQELGFSLGEIQQLLELRVDPDTSCADVRDRAEAKITDVRQKIRDLRRMERALRRLADACPGEGSTDGCPILDLVHLEPQEEQREQTGR